MPTIYFISRSISIASVIIVSKMPLTYMVSARFPCQYSLVSSSSEILPQIRVRNNPGAGASMLPLAPLAPPTSFRGTIDRRFPAGRRSEPVHGFAAASVHRVVSSAFAVFSQNAC